jgi:hypothetical protein
VPRPTLDTGGLASRRAFLRAVGLDDNLQALAWASPIDLADAESAVLRFWSLRPNWLSGGYVEISQNGTDWITAAAVPAGSDWMPVAVDLSQFAGQVVYLRLVYAGTPVEDDPALAWIVDGISVEIRRRRTRRLPLQPPR